MHLLSLSSLNTWLWTFIRSQFKWNLISKGESRNTMFKSGKHQSLKILFGITLVLLLLRLGLSTWDLFLRKCVTFLFTFLVLGMSFAVVYGLSTVQVHNQSNRYISFLISLCIVLFNYVINSISIWYR